MTTIMTLTPDTLLLLQVLGLLVLMIPVLIMLLTLRSRIYPPDGLPRSPDSPPPVPHVKPPLPKKP